MDNIYYLTHPRLGKTAVVYAPTTEKARTTFLDWLERNNLIRRANRSFFRRDMITERIEDPDVPRDVTLNYGYKDFTGRFEFEKPEVAPGWEGEDYRKYLAEIGEREPTREEAERWLEEERQQMREVIPEIKDSEVPKSKLMPVQQVMLRGYLE